MVSRADYSRAARADRQSLRDRARTRRGRPTSASTGSTPSAAIAVGVDGRGRRRSAARKVSTRPPWSRTACEVVGGVEAGGLRELRPEVADLHHPARRRAHRVRGSRRRTAPAARSCRASPGRGRSGRPRRSRPRPSGIGAGVGGNELDAADPPGCGGDGHLALDLAARRRRPSAPPARSSPAAPGPRAPSSRPASSSAATEVARASRSARRSRGCRARGRRARRRRSGARRPRATRPSSSAERDQALAEVAGRQRRRGRGGAARTSRRRRRR